MDLGVLCFTVVICAVVILFVWLSRSDTGASEESEKKSSHDATEESTEKVLLPKTMTKKKNLTRGIKEKASQYTHPHHLVNLRGHTAPVTDGGFSPNGRHFISVAEDRTVLIWSVKDFINRKVKYSHCNLEYDHATKFYWSPDSKAFIIHKASENALEVYKLTKKSDGSFDKIQPALTFPQCNSDGDILSLAIAVTGKFIMTCDSRNQVILWDLHGEILDSIDTRHGTTHSATLSPCGRFIGTTGFTPDAKVWEVKFDKAGVYEGLKRVFELTGHKSSICNCDFNSDSTKMTTVSKDGTWRLFDTNVEYAKGQDPILLHTGTFEWKNRRTVIRLTPDGRTIALSHGADIYFFSAITGEKLGFIPDVYYDDILDLKFDPTGKYIITLGEKQMRVFHNVAGYMTTIQDLKRSREKATAAGMRERIDSQIEEAKSTLKDIEKLTENYQKK